MDLSKIKSITIPEGKVKKITRKIDGAVLWNTGYKNWVKYSTEADGITIYNGGLGYKDGYRIRSGGAEGATARGAHTGYIPVQPNDTVRISGCEFSGYHSENAINISDSNFTNLGQMAMNSTLGYGSLAGTTYGNRNYVVEEKTGVWKWTVPPASYGAAYIRVSGYKESGGDGASLIVTINEEIT